MDTITPPELPASRPAYSSEEKALVILCHLSALLGVGFLLPLVIYLVKKGEAGPVAAHAKEVLNFHISVLIYSVGAFLLAFVGVGFLLLPVIALGALVLAVVAAVKASEGVLYRYPLTLRFIS